MFVVAGARDRRRPILARCAGRRRQHSPTAADFARAFGDVLTLRHLHGSGADCTSAEETAQPAGGAGSITARSTDSCCVSPRRRWRPSITSCSAGWRRIRYTSLPVLLGTAGGAGCWSGPAGLLMRAGTARPGARRSRLSDGLDESFIALLFLTSLTGLLLLASSRAGGDGRAADRAPRRGARAVCHAAVRQVRARPLSNGRADSLRDGEPAHRGDGPIA